MDNAQAMPINGVTIVVIKMDAVGRIVVILIIMTSETFQTPNGSEKIMGNIWLFEIVRVK